MAWLLLLEKGIWFGFAALGFAVLFNVPVRTLFAIFMMAAVGCMIKVITLQLGINLILATLIGASVIGSLSIFFAHNRHAPPLVFSIPAVIPMVPGVLAYRMMLGLIKLTTQQPADAYNQVLAETAYNGLMVLFILMCLAGGVAIPMLMTRKESAKEIRIFKRVS